MFSENIPCWVSMFPTGVAEIIKKHELFGYNPSKLLEKSN
jgi:hypothetical protein